MSGPVVAIGYLLLIPTLLGMLFGILFIATDTTAGGVWSGIDSLFVHRRVVGLAAHYEKVCSSVQTLPSDCG
jgi:hypothetical protein